MHKALIEEGNLNHTYYSNIKNLSLYKTELFMLIFGEIIILIVIYCLLKLDGYIDKGSFILIVIITLSINISLIYILTRKTITILQFNFDNNTLILHYYTFKNGNKSEKLEINYKDIRYAHKLIAQGLKDESFILYIGELKFIIDNLYFSKSDFIEISQLIHKYFKSILD